MEYDIHKGVGKSVEFKGLQSQYLIGFFIGIFSLFVLFIIFRVTGIPISINICIIGCLAGGVVYYVFTYNKKYGRYGLMKKNARGRCPRFVIRRKSFFIMLKSKL